MSFQDELEKVSRDKDEIERMDRNIQIEEGIEMAEKSYKEIKKGLLEKAKNGQFTEVDGKRQIVLYFSDYNISSKLGFRSKSDSIRVNKTLLHPNGELGTHLYFTQDKKREIVYNSFMEKLKELCKTDQISLKLVGYYEDMFTNKGYEYPIFGVKCKGYLNISGCSIKIRCIVDY